MPLERKSVDIWSGGTALTLSLTLVAVVAAGSCVSPSESAPATRAVASALTDECPCEPGYVCAGDPATCQPDCSVQRCDPGYFCDWSSLLCTPYTPPPPPIWPPRDPDCRISGCPVSFVCVDGACQENGFPTTSGCQFDWECGAGERCKVEVSVGTCVSGDAGSSCSSEMDCDPGLQCGSDGKCVTGTDECRNSYDCRAGYECENRHCTQV